VRHITDTDNPNGNGQGNGKGEEPTEPTTTYEHLHDRTWAKVDEETGEAEISYEIQKDEDLNLPPDTEADEN